MYRPPLIQFGIAAGAALLVGAIAYAATVRTVDI